MNNLNTGTMEVGDDLKIAVFQSDIDEEFDPRMIARELKDIYFILSTQIGLFDGTKMDEWTKFAERFKY